MRWIFPEKSAPGAQLRQIIRILQTERGQVRLAVTGAAMKHEIENPPAKTQVYMYFIQGTTDDEYQPYHYEQGK